MKKILILLLIGIMIIPYQVFADSPNYNTMNLDEVLKEERIEHDFSNYKETDNQITIYLFRGKGCSFCERFLVFLNSIMDDYGKYFKVVSYEVWYDQTNASLMEKVGNFLGVEVEGVPFIVIGEQVFPGYLPDWDENIKETIKKEYENKDRYDVIEEMDKSGLLTSSNGNTNPDNSQNYGTTLKNTSSTSDDSATIIVCNLLFITIATSIILAFIHVKNKKLQEKIEELLSESSVEDD